MKINLSKYAFIIPTLLLFLTACDLDVPVKEMVDAKTGIEEGYKYKADKYSPEELKGAEKELLMSNEFLKNEKAKDAKKSAIESKVLSDKALEKSLPLYSADLLQNAEEAWTKAEKLFASRFSPEKFNEAGEKLSMSKEANTRPDYKESLELSAAVISLSNQAIEDSLKNKTVLQNGIESLKTRLSVLEKSPFKDAAGDEIRGADENLKKAEAHMADNDFRETVASTENAEKDVTAAERIVEANTIYAEIKQLRSEINSALADEKNSAVRGDLDKALSALNRGVTLAEQADFPAAKKAVNEAENLLAGSKIKAKEALLLSRIEKARKELTEAENMDTELAHEKNLAIARSLINESDNELKAGRHDKSEDAIDEAETMIAAIKNSIERAAIEARVAAEAAKEEKTDETASETVEEKPVSEEKIYVVQWRKKDTDCLWRIALKVYDDASFWPAIYIANKNQIKDPDLIFPGQKFKIPAKPEKRPEYKPEKSKGADKKAD